MGLGEMRKESGLTSLTETSGEKVRDLALLKAGTGCPRFVLLSVCMLVHLRIHRQGIPYCIYEWVRMSGTKFRDKGKDQGQRVGPLSSQREQRYGNRFEGRFQAT